MGLATGPALFAWDEHSDLGPLIERKFGQEGDVELVRITQNNILYHVPVLTNVVRQARDLVRRSSGVERTRELAMAHANKAKELIAYLPDGDAKEALEVLTDRVVKRTW